jgi:2-dehydropantoate 2-reductase
VRVLVAGTGGVGGYYGGRLLDAGHDVRFLARGENLRAMRSHGLTVRATSGDLRFDTVNAVSDAAEAGPVEAILFCVKTYDNVSTADAAAGAVAPGTIICSLQNGIDNERFLAGRFPEAVVLGGVARIEAWVDSPGVVVQRGGLADMTVGAYRVEDRAAAASLAEAFAVTPVPATVSEDIEGALWFKLLVIAGLGGATAYGRCSIGAVRSDPALRRLLVGAFEEVEAVAAAKAISLPPDPIQTVLTSVDNYLDPAAKSSMCRDVERGRPLEVEAINGAVAREGEATGVPTPANSRILDALLPLHDAATAARDVSR